MIRKDQKGFSPLIVIIILVVIGAVGFGGWYVWNQQNDKNTETTPSQSAQTPTSSEPARDPSENGKYLVIKEWNVRFPIPAEMISKVSYVVSSDTSRIELKSSTVDLSDCAPLVVNRSAQEGFGDLKINEFYYAILSGAQACDTSDSPRQKAAAEVQEKLSESLQKLESI